MYGAPGGCSPRTPIARPRQAPVPVGSTVGVETAGGEQGLHAGLSALAHPGPDLAGRSSGPQHLGLDRDGTGIRREQVVGAGGDDIAVWAHRCRGTAQDGQQVAPVGLPPDGPVWVDGGIEAARPGRGQRGHLFEGQLGQARRRPSHGLMAPNGRLIPAACRRHPGPALPAHPVRQRVSPHPEQVITAWVTCTATLVDHLERAARRAPRRRRPTGAWP